MIAIFFSSFSCSSLMERNKISNKSTQTCKKILTFYHYYHNFSKFLFFWLLGNAIYTHLKFLAFGFFQPFNLFQLNVSEDNIVLGMRCRLTQIVTLYLICAKCEDEKKNRSKKIFSPKHIKKDVINNRKRTVFFHMWKKTKIKSHGKIVKIVTVSTFFCIFYSQSASRFCNVNEFLMSLIPRNEKCFDFIITFSLHGCHDSILYILTLFSHLKKLHRYSGKGRGSLFFSVFCSFLSLSLYLYNSSE